MSLYVRVFTNFYTHRKTVRLRLALGDDALWLMPRLWAYAAENQPDGVFEGYSAQEIAELVGYKKDATSMLQAMLQASFLDDSPLRIHGWREHNGYHDAFAVRAKKAAAARWKGKDNDKTRKERKGKEASIAQAMLQACEQIYAEYPKKVARPKAIAAIAAALKTTDPALLLEKTKAYAKARVGQEVKFTPHPSTWFNQRRFEDDPSTWADPPPKSPSAAARADAAKIAADKRDDAFLARLNASIAKP